MCTGHLHICTEEGVHLHMLTIVKMDICTYGQLWTIVDNCGQLWTIVDMDKDMHIV